VRETETNTAKSSTSGLECGYSLAVPGKAVPDHDFMVPTEEECEVFKNVSIVIYAQNAAIFKKRNLIQPSFIFNEINRFLG
jgi:hypothetical protein